MSADARICGGLKSPYPLVMDLSVIVSFSVIEDLVRGISVKRCVQVIEAIMTLSFCETMLLCGWVSQY